MAQPTLLNKSITTSSSGMLGFFSSQTVLYTSGSSAQIGTSSGAVASLLDTGRRIIFWSSAAASDSLIITLTGVSDSGDAVTERILGSSAAGSIRTTVQDFQSVTSVTFSSSLNVRMNMGTSSRAGTPWITTNSWANPFDMAVQLTFTATGTASANFECTLEDITQTVPGPNKLLSSSNPQIVPWYPTPFISQTPGSTFVSTAIDAVTTANFTSPISAWRVTLISSSSNASQLGVSVLQTG
jgi:hypothetical protein